MSNNELIQKITSAHMNDDSHAARDVYNEWLVSHCSRLRHQRIYDAHTQTYRYIQVPCGLCYHCRQTKINEWCTRMYAHAEDYAYVYFITLTYRSVTNPDLPINKLYLSKLKDAVWHYDKYNYTKRLSYSPCILVKKHYQDFIKRLRKNTCIDCTYILSGEYGKKFGRPHFHMILFSRSPVTIDDVRRAWSFTIWKTDKGDFEIKKNQKHNGKSYVMPIGNVDFNDLVSNGSFNQDIKIKVDGQYLNSALCFKYVCKYVVKRDNANLTRVQLAHKNLFKTQKYIDLYGESILISEAARYLRKFMNEEQIRSCFSIAPKYNRIYEKNDFIPRKNIANGSHLQQSKEVLKNTITYTEDIYPPLYYDFSQKFAPFCEFSRATPIGSLYAKTHIQEFAEGVFCKPVLQADGFVVPSYFRDKAKEYLYGLRVVSSTLSGRSLCLYRLPELLRYFEDCAASCTAPFASKHNSSVTDDYNEIASKSSLLFASAYSGERVAFAENNANFYKYSRSERKYKLTRKQPLSVWLRENILSLQNELVRYSYILRRSQENMRLFDKAKLLLTDLGIDVQKLNQDYEDKCSLFKYHQQQEYHAVHKSAE